MKLITVKEDGFTLDISPEVYLIGEFAELINSRGKNKDLLLKEIGFIYFFADLGSDFQFQTDEYIREKDLIKYLGLEYDWKPDDKVKTAIEAYRYLSQTVSSKLLSGVYIVVSKIEEQLKKIDLNERDKSGKPVWNIKQIQEVAQKLPDVMESIQKAEKVFIKSQEENTKIRGTKTKSMYEDDL